MDTEKEIIELKNRIAQLESSLSELSKLHQKSLTRKSTIYGFIGSFLFTIILINIIFLIVGMIN